MAKQNVLVAALQQGAQRGTKRRTKAEMMRTANESAAWFQRGGVTWGETMAEANVSLAKVASEFRAMLVATGWNGATLPKWKELEAVLEAARARTLNKTGRKAGMPHVPEREEIAIGVVRKYDALYAPQSIEGEGDARRTVVRCGTGSGADTYFAAIKAAGELNAERLYRMPLAAFKVAYAADPKRAEAMKEVRNMAGRKCSEAWGFIVEADKRARAPKKATTRGTKATTATTATKATTATTATTATKATETSLADVHPKVVVEFARKRGIELPLAVQAAAGAYLKAIDAFLATLN